MDARVSAVHFSVEQTPVQREAGMSCYDPCFIAVCFNVYFALASIKYLETDLCQEAACCRLLSEKHETVLCWKIPEGKALPRLPSRTVFAPQGSGSRGLPCDAAR